MSLAYIIAKFFAPVQSGPGAHPTSCTVGTGSLLGIKRSGRGFYHLPSSMVEVNEGVELCLYTPSRTSWPVTWRTSGFICHFFFQVLRETLSPKIRQAISCDTESCLCGLCEGILNNIGSFNPLKTKRRLLYLKIQSVPRS